MKRFDLPKLMGILCLTFCSVFANAQCGNILVDPDVDINAVDDGSGNYSLDVEVKNIQWLGGNPSFYLIVDGEQSDHYAATPEESKVFTWTNTFDFYPQLSDIYVLLCNSTNGNGCNCTSEPFPLGQVLPVKLEDFSARFANESVKLNWITSSEVNSDYFEVEYSSDNKEFETLGMVKAMGNSNEIQHYEYVSDNTSSSNNYYRLKQVDLDGSFEMSTVIYLRKSINKEEVKVFPNPVSSELTIEASEGASWVLHNGTGQEVLTGSAKKISMQEYPSGMYFIRVRNRQTNDLKTLQVIKE